MVTLQSVQDHTGLTHPFQFFDIWELWRSVLSARVPKCQKIKKGVLDQYRHVALNALLDSFLPQSEKVWN